MNARTIDDLKLMAARCNALYICPKRDGVRVGPLVPYAGKDAEGKNFVGDIYFNFRRIEENMMAVRYYAETIVQLLPNWHSFSLPDFEPGFDTVCGIPQGGRTLGQELAQLINCRFVYADKKPLPTESGKKQEYEWDLSQFSFKAGERLLVVEDVFNNFQNTDNTLTQIARTGAKVVLLAGALNRSTFARTAYEPKGGTYAGKSIPIVAAINEPYPEYKQDDPEVVADIAAGNIEWEVKKNWSRLMEAMDRHD